jgi:hypothetical protein
MVLLRAAERVGWCVLGGCVVAAALAPILMSRGEATGNLILATLGAATLAGVFWGTLSRPTRLAAATEADRQLRWADLLGTAVALRPSRSEDGMTAAVLALADARCRTATPATVVLHRFGARGWGGIGLALAFVTGLNLLGPEPTRSAHRESARADSWQEVEAAREEGAGRSARSPHVTDLRRAKTGNGVDDDPSSQSTEVTEARPVSNVAQAPGSRDNASGGGNSDGTGAGAGRSSAAKPDGAPIVPKMGGLVDPSQAGATAAGGGVGTRGNSVDSGAVAGTAAGQGGGPAKRPVPPWQSQGWAEDRGAAEAAVREGRVPDAYRDLVRGYFRAN